MGNRINVGGFGQIAQGIAQANGTGNNSGLINSFDRIAAQNQITDSRGNLLNRFSVGNAGNSQINRAAGAVNRLEGLTNFGQATPIATRLLEVQNTANQQAVNNIAAQQAGQLNQGISALARQGGVTSGARERLAANAANAAILARQNQSFQNQAAQQQIAANDANTQLGILQSLPGQRQNIANFQRTGVAADVNTLLQNNAQQQGIAATRAETLLNQQNTPKGGLGGTVQGILGK